MLYREKLQSLADKAMAQYGTSVLHIDTSGPKSAEQDPGANEKSPVDFFDSHTKGSNKNMTQAQPMTAFSYETTEQTRPIPAQPPTCW